MLLQIAAVFLIVIFSGGIFIACGDWLYCKAVSEGSSHPVSFRIGAGFFLGMALFETLWKLMAYVSGNAKITLAVTVLIMGFFALINVKNSLLVLKTCFSSFGIRKIFKILLIILFAASVYMLEILINIEPFAPKQFSTSTNVGSLHTAKEIIPLIKQQFSILTNLGSLHSGRYANIATFILESDSIPVLNQNFGQSMLAAVPLIVGFNSPFLALNLWLSTSVIFMCIAFYGFFIMLGLNNLMSLAGSILLMIGNTALSLFAINVVDSGSPLFLSGYTDAVFSVGSFFVFLILLKNFYDDQIKSDLCFLAAAAVLCVSWSFTASQNIVLSAILVTIISGIMSVQKRLSRKHKLLYAFMVIFVIAGATQGGMLTPWPLCSNKEIPGVISTAGYNRPDNSTCFNFAFFFTHIINGRQVLGMFNNNREIYQGWEAYKQPENLRPKYFVNGINDNYDEVYYRIEADFFNSLRIVFFPLLGLVLPWFISGFKRAVSDSELLNLKKIWFAAFILFLIGYLLVFSIQFNGYKWEFTRFLILGYAMALISFIASLNIILKRFSRRKSGLILFAVMFVMTFGQISLIIYQINENVFATGNSKILPFSERFNMLINLQGMQAAYKLDK